jgi:hypothetical protein
MTTYLGAVAQEQVDQAQAELERHLVIGPSGRCRTCGEVEPCRGRQAATEVFLRYGRLPRRQPGLTCGKTLTDRR